MIPSTIAVQDKWRCLFRQYDFPGFPWISVLLGLQGSNKSSLCSALSFWCPAVTQRWLLVSWMNFLELSALNFPFSEVVFKMLHFCELFTDNFGAIKQSWVCCRKSQHKQIFSATDIFSTVLSLGSFSASVSSSQNKAIFHYDLFICTDFQLDWRSTFISHTQKKCPHTDFAANSKGINWSTWLFHFHFCVVKSLEEFVLSSCPCELIWYSLCLLFCRTSLSQTTT